MPGFDPALTVLATVISRHGTMAVLDCGRKSIGIDRTPPELVGGDGAIRYEHGEHFIHEEHTALDLDAGLALERRRPRRAHARLLADDRQLLRHATTSSEDDRVIDVWPILGRYGSATAGVGPRRSAAAYSTLPEGANA